MSLKSKSKAMAKGQSATIAAAAVAGLVLCAAIRTADAGLVSTDWGAQGTMSVDGGTTWQDDTFDDLPIEGELYVDNWPSGEAGATYHVWANPLSSPDVGYSVNIAAAGTYTKEGSETALTLSSGLIAWQDFDLDETTNVTLTYSLSGLWVHPSADPSDYNTSTSYIHLYGDSDDLITDTYDITIDSSARTGSYTFTLLAGSYVIDCYVSAELFAHTSLAVTDPHIGSYSFVDYEVKFEDPPPSFALSAVPEPAGLGLLLTGAATLASRRRRCC